MSSRAWMPLYIGDYLADTSHLDATAHGVYLLLLMRCWTKGSLPEDRMQCMSIAHAMHEQCMSTVDAVLAEFFTLEEDGFHNKRIDLEREKSGQSYERRANAAKARWSGMQCMSNADALHMQPQPQPQPQPTPEQEQQTSSRSSPKPPKIPDEIVEAIYQAYPKHAAKQDALKAIRAALAKVAPDVLLEAAQAYAAAVTEWSAEDREYIPLPATWIRKGKWEDDRTTWIRGFPTQQPNRKKTNGAKWTGFGEIDYEKGATKRADGTFMF